MTKQTDIVVSLLRLGAFLTREGNRLLQDAGLNQQQYVVLNHIYHRQPINQKEICSGLQFEKSNVSKIIKKLVQLKLAAGIRDTRDSRGTRLKITRKGEELVIRCNEKCNRWNEKWLSGLSEQQLAQVSSALSLLSGEPE